MEPKAGMILSRAVEFGTPEAFVITLSARASRRLPGELLCNARPWAMPGYDSDMIAQRRGISLRELFYRVKRGRPDQSPQPRRQHFRAAAWPHAKPGILMSLECLVGDGIQ